MTLKPSPSSPLPKRYYVACSGGVDSMVALHWLNVGKPSRSEALLGVIHVHHNTGKYADLAQSLVTKYCEKNKFPLLIHRVCGTPPPGQSKEMWWRERRYGIFKKYEGDVILAHHLNDCMEEYLMSSIIRGYTRVIPYRHANCIRPFRHWLKEDIYQYAIENDVPWLRDPSNDNNNFKRNYTRNVLMWEVYKLNPGFHKVVGRLINEKHK